MSETTVVDLRTELVSAFALGVLPPNEICAKFMISGEYLSRLIDDATFLREIAEERLRMAAAGNAKKRIEAVAQAELERSIAALGAMARDPQQGTANRIAAANQLARIAKVDQQMREGVPGTGELAARFVVNIHAGTEHVRIAGPLDVDATEEAA